MSTDEPHTPKASTPDDERRTATDRSSSIDGNRAQTGGSIDGASVPKTSRAIVESLTDRATVRIAVDGEIATDCLVGGDGTVHDGTEAISRIEQRGGRNEFRFSGRVTDLHVLEGEVEVAFTVRDPNPGAGGRPARLAVHAQGTDVDYRFVVSGAVGDPSDDTPGDGTSDAEETVTGTVTGSGVDEYRYTGAITEFETSTDRVLVTLDDAVVDPADLH